MIRSLILLAAIIAAVIIAISIGWQQIAIGVAGLAAFYLVWCALTFQ